MPILNCKGVEYAGPTADAFVEGTQVVFFVGRMDLVVVLAKANQHRLRADNILEVACDGYRAAAAYVDAFVVPFAG